MNTPRLRRLLVASTLTVVVAFALGGCATTTTMDSDSTSGVEDDVLILAVDGFELHYRSGEVVAVRPAGSGPALTPTEERVRTYRDFKKMYELRSETDLPSVLPPDGVDVLGWRGLECVRPGGACGPRPAEPPTDQAVRVKLKFGR